MKPVKLFAENFKGLDFSHDLKLVNMFAGPNESGKTARIRAALVALLGYDPEVGKQPGSTISFAAESRPQMTVHMEFDDGSHITRTFTRKPNGETSRSNKGSIPEIPPVLFDASDYLHATAQERIKTVFEKIDVTKIALSDDDLLKKLGAIEVLPAALSQEAVKNLIESTKKYIARRNALKQTIQAWLEEMVRGFQDASKNEKTQMDRASAEMTSLRQSGKTPESVADKIKAVKEKITALEKAKSELDAAVNSHQRTEARRSVLQQSLAKPAVDIAALEKQKADIDAKVAEYKSSTHEFTTNLTNLQREISALEVASKNIRETRVKLEKRIAELDGHVKCPYCKSNRQGWKEDHRTELQEELKTVLESESGTDHKLTTIRDHTAGVKSDIALCQKKDAEIANLKNESIRLNNELVLARKSQTERAAAQGELDGLNQITRPTDEQLAQASEDLRLARNELSTLESQEAIFTAFQANAGKFKEVEGRIIRHQVAQEVFKRAASLVIEEQKAIVAQAFDSILAPARRFTDGIIGGRLDYQNDELGISTDLGWVSHKVMSGRGKDLAYLGLQVALAQQSPIKAILVDEFGDFDLATKKLVINRFLELAREGFIHTALCADPRPDDYKDFTDNDFQLVVLGE